MIVVVDVICTTFTIVTIYHSPRYWKWHIYHSTFLNIGQRGWTHDAQVPSSPFSQYLGEVRCITLTNVIIYQSPRYWSGTCTTPLLKILDNDDVKHMCQELHPICPNIEDPILDVQLSLAIPSIYLLDFERGTCTLHLLNIGCPKAMIITPLLSLHYSVEWSC